MPSYEGQPLPSHVQDERPWREALAKTASIIVGGLGATMPGGESVPKIREKFAPPRKYPSKSAP
jgi:hypothetical protein